MQNVDLRVVSTSTLSDAARTYLQGRGLSEEVAARYELSSRRTKGGGEFLIFPHYKQENIVNTHYRLFSENGQPAKKFWMEEGKEVCLWNYDILTDPALKKTDTPLVITESRIDALSWIMAGYEWVVSVPNGAQEQVPFIEEAMPLLKNVARFAIAVDDDASGEILQQAITRSLPLPRCDIVKFPKGCKDSNETLVEHGPEALMQCLEMRRHVPHLGAYYARDFIGTTFDPKQFETRIAGLDQYFRPFLGGFGVLTGTPGTGKSLMVRSICFALAYHHGLKSVIGSFENPPPQVIDKLKQAHQHKTKSDDVAAMNFVDEHFHFVVADAPEIRGEEVEKTDLAWFLDAAATFIIREGVQVVVIDPWNELEHYRNPQETMSEYIGRMIREMKRFARRYNVFVLVVAHPTKLEYDKKEKTFRKPNLYDIYGSSAWYDKADIGIVLHRSKGSLKLEVDIQKIRFDVTGRTGEEYLRWADGPQEYESWDNYNAEQGDVDW